MPPRPKRVVLTEKQRDLAAQYRGLVIKVARTCYPFGMIPDDAISEGCVGLCIAAARFDSSRNILFSTYATYWIRALIFEYILRTYGPVRLGTTYADRKAFFGITKARQETGTDDAAEIAKVIGIDEDAVRNMQVRLSRNDLSIDAPRSHNDDRSYDIADDQTIDPETAAMSEGVRATIQSALYKLKPRERQVVRGRFFERVPKTLDDLGKDLGISRERVRQIEAKAIVKLREMLV